jgi:hypothetical protein
VSYVLAPVYGAIWAQTVLPAELRVGRRSEVRNSRGSLGRLGGSWGRGLVFKLELELQEAPAELFSGLKARIANESPEITAVEGQQ